MLRLDVTGALRELSQAIDAEAARAVADGAASVVDAARRNHTFTNRTGRLERSIRAAAPRGRASRGLVSVDVLGATPYGGFVEEGTSRSRPYPYLTPAWHLQEQEFARRVEAGLARAASLAWGGA